MTASRIGIVAFGSLVLLAPAARGQSVAFFPTVSTFPNGVTMSTTPVVSFDRRYVRLGVNPQFTVLEGFDPFLVPAAVGGGPGGPGALGGIQGVLGQAGMNGPIAGGGMGAGAAAPGAGFTAAGRGAAGFSSSDFEDQAAFNSVQARAQPRRLAPQPRTTRTRSRAAKTSRQTARSRAARAATPTR